MNAVDIEMIRIVILMTKLKRNLFVLFIVLKHDDIRCDWRNDVQNKFQDKSSR